MRKRLLSFVLAVLMIASLLPATALAANIVDSGTCGAEVTWTLDSDGVLTISGSGYMCDYGSSGAPWHGRVKSAVIAEGVTSIGWCAFYDCASLTSVTIPDSVTRIGSYAFYDCRSLTSVTIPDSVTRIGDGAFEGCTSLTSVTIPDSVTSIGGDTFRYCTALTSVTIPNSVTSIGGWAFYNCTSLTSVTIPDSVTRIGDWAFYNCTSLTSVTIPNSVTSIVNGVFNGCESLTSVTIPDSVTSIGSYAFSGCSSLTSVTIPNSVTSIGSWAFDDCTSLTSVTIPNSVTLIDNYAFKGCESLTSVTIPDSVTSIGDGAFEGCTSLTSVTIPDSVTRIGDGAFASCTSLTGIWVAEGSSHYASDAFGVLFNKDKTTLVQCPGAFSGSYAIPDSVTSIGGSAFRGCSSLTSVTIPDSVTSIGKRAFSYCKSLTDVYYAGSEAQWKAISISSTGNDDLLTANIHYNYVSHTHSYKDVVTAPTCTEKGYTTHTCSCGDSYVDTYTDALGHAWDSGKVTKQPTATETGIRTYTCTRCSATKTETIPATGSVDVTQMFTDVTKNWAYPGIQYCVTHGIMGGMGDGTFAPTGTTTRAQIVQILYNLEGTPAVSGTTPFTDLTANWYKPAILWAYQNNVVAGTSPTTFAPDQPVTREQIAVILTQYMFHVLKMERTWTPADLSTFPDGAQVSSWAKEAMQDAVALGLINGTKASDGVVYLDPQGSAARQQVATILMNFCQNVKK